MYATFKCAEYTRLVTSCLCCKDAANAGNDDFPVVSLFDEGVLGPGSRIESENSEAVAAYHRASSLAKEIAAAVVLQEGDMLVIHNGRYTSLQVFSELTLSILTKCNCLIGQSC